MFVYMLESLFGCFDDMPSCCYGYWCLPCAFGTNAEKIDDSSCVGMCLAYWVLGSCYLCWIPHMMKRKVLRQKFSLKPDPCDDCLVAAFCGPCGVCQEARELKAKGMYSTIRMLYHMCFCVKF
jgi:Cys-rich protein (TIGR01571 family)